MLPIEMSTEITMRMTADDIERKVGDKYGFMVLVFPFSEGIKTANYISNCDRGSMIKALREKADVLEQGRDIAGTSNEQ